MVTDFEKYRLYIGQIEADASGKEPPYMGINTSVAYEFDGVSHQVTLLSLKYHKRIYQPNELLATLCISRAKKDNAYVLPTNDAIKQVFFRKPVRLTVNTGTASNSVIKEVARQFFVFRMKPIYKGGSSASVTVELSIYSQDKLLTLDKHSMAYTAKKLGKDIFNSEVPNYTLDESTMETDITYTQKTKDKNNNDFTTNTHTSVQGTMPTAIDLQFLSNGTDELRIPYAVQYNESFYDFLVRIANRYGEFLFFEDGTFHLGLKNPSEGNYKNGSVVIDWATRAREYYFESVLAEGIEVEDRHYPYLDRADDSYSTYAAGSSTTVGTAAYTTGTKDDVGGEDEMTEAKLGKMVESTDESPNPKDEKQKRADGNYDVTRTTYYENGQKVEKGVMKVSTDDKGNVKKDSDGNVVMEWVGTPKVYYQKKQEGNTVEQATSYDKRRFYYNDPVAADAYNDVIEKDGYSSYSKEHYKYWEKCVMGDILSILTGTTLWDMLNNIVWTEAWRAINAGLAATNKNFLNNTSNITPYANIADQYNSSDGKVAQFTTLKESSELKDKIAVVSNQIVEKLTSIFYSVIRKSEKEVGQDAVWVSFEDDYYPIKLGDKIQLSGKDYVVIDVEGSYRQDAKTGIEDQLRVVAVPICVKSGSSSVVVCPPALPNMIIREAKPQVAFVAANVDPQKLGRVRIRYPWQNADGDPSPWIRVALPMATNGGGVNFKPQISDEVMVSYEDGNVDRPYVVGYLQSKYCMQKWGALPDRGIMSKNGHSLQFIDPVDGSSFFTNMLPIVPFIRGLLPAYDWPKEFTGSSQDVVDLSGSTVIQDRYGLYKIACSSDARVVSIQSAMGNVVLSAFTGITITAPNGDITIAGKNVKIAASNKVDIVSGTNVNSRWYPGHNMQYATTGLEEFGNAVANKFLQNTFDKLLDFKFLRTVFETFFHPIEGTTKIKSFSFLQMEAGLGTTEIPVDNYRTGTTLSGIGSHGPSKWIYNSGDYTAKKLTETLNLIPRITISNINPFITAYRAMCDAIATFRASVNGRNAPNSNSVAITFDAIKGRAFSNNNAAIVQGDCDFTSNLFERWNVRRYVDVKPEPKKPKERAKSVQKKYQKIHKKWVDDRPSWETKERNRVRIHNNDVESRKQTVVAQAEALRQAMRNAYLEAERYNAPVFNLGESKESHVYVNELREAIQATTLSEIQDLRRGATSGININTVMPQDLTDVNAVRKMKRFVAYRLIEILNTRDKDFKTNFMLSAGANYNINGSDANWDAFVNCLVNVPPQRGRGVEAKLQLKKDRLLNHFTDPFRGWGSPWRWSSEMKPQILMSDLPGKTISFKSGQLEAGENVVTITQKYVTELRKKLKGI